MQEYFKFAKVGFVALFLATAATAAAEVPALDETGTEPQSQEIQSTNVETLDVRASNSYVAVYYSNSTGSWGAGRYGDLETAKVLARGYCPANDCVLLFTMQNSCGVLATGTNFVYGWATNPDHTAALTNALQTCSRYTTNCKVAVDLCT